MYKRNTKKNLFLPIFSAVLSLILVVSAILCIVPKTRTAIADFVADKFSPAYEQQVKDNEEKQVLINDLNSQIEDKDKDLETANQQIVELEEQLLNAGNSADLEFSVIESQKLIGFYAGSEDPIMFAYRIQNFTGEFIVNQSNCLSQIACIGSYDVVVTDYNGISLMGNKLNAFTFDDEFASNYIINYVFDNGDFSNIDVNAEYKLDLLDTSSYNVNEDGIVTSCCLDIYIAAI